MANEQKSAEINPSDEVLAKIAQMVANAVTDATVKVQERLHPTEARFSSKTSAYNPEGLDKRPKLERRYIFGGGEMSERFLTNEEIVLLNKVSKSGDYHENRWHVRVRRDDSNRETVTIDFPSKTIDDRMDLPRSLKEIITEILAEQSLQEKQQLKAK